MTDEDDQIAEALEKFHRERNASKSFAAPKAEGRDPTQDVDGIRSDAFEMNGKTFRRSDIVPDEQFYTIPPGVRLDERMSTLSPIINDVRSWKGVPIDYGARTTAIGGPGIDRLESFSSMEGIRQRDVLITDGRSLKNFRVTVTIKSDGSDATITTPFGYDVNMSDMVVLGEGYYMDPRSRAVFSAKEMAWSYNEGLTSA